MGHTVERADLILILETLESSTFTHFMVEAGGMRINARRFGSTDTATGKIAGSGAEAALVPAPRVGFFRLAIAPGSDVGADTVIGSIKAFRKTISVKAGHAGTITAVLVPDGAFVEYGQALARVKIASAGAAR